jgi:hydrogenase maturation protease
MAGDDGAGIAVVRHIREMPPPAGVEVIEIAEPSALIPLLTDRVSPVVLIDAIVDAGEPGRVLRLRPGGGARRARLLSSHGVGVLEAIDLALTLNPDDFPQKVEIIAITIARPAAYGAALSPEVARVVGQAAGEAVRLAGM